MHFPRYVVCRPARSFFFLGFSGDGQKKQYDAFNLFSFCKKKTILNPIVSTTTVIIFDIELFKEYKHTTRSLEQIACVCA
jgi:hypothetical protein